MRPRKEPDRLRRALTFLACVAAAGLLAPAGGAAESAPGEAVMTVSGVVHDVDGHPLGGATVVLGGHETRTDDAGRWSVALSPGAGPERVQGLLEVRVDGQVLPGRGHRHAGIDDDPLELREKLRVEDVALPRPVADRGPPWGDSGGPHPTARTPFGPVYSPNPSPGNDVDLRLACRPSSRVNSLRLP